MLKAFENQLRSLAADHEGQFENHVRQRWQQGEPPRGLTEELKEFIVLLPRIEKRIFSLWTMIPENSKIREAGSYFLTYIYQPEDFLPENLDNGLFGYLDDAYLAAIFFELMMEEIDHAGHFRIRRADRDLMKRVVGLRRKAAAVIPGEAARIRLMVGNLLEGDDSGFQELFAGRIPA